MSYKVISDDIRVMSEHFFSPKQPLRVCLVGVKTRRMENRVEKCCELHFTQIPSHLPLTLL